MTTFRTVRVRVPMDEALMAQDKQILPNHINK